MPNWCKNNLKIYSNGEKTLELLELLKNEKGEMTFNKFLPMPKELNDTEKQYGTEMTDEKSKELRDKYGADNWYDWRCENWGCKWDASESAFYKNGDYWMVSFQTPWGPPIEFVQALSKKFNTMEFVMQYADENIGGSPLGEATFTNGEVMYDGPDMDSDDREEYSDLVWDEGWVDDWGGTKGGNM